MAGKTRRRAPAPVVPQGHMELKSSALCTTDAKLVSQYLVVEHMAAHYKKLNEAKSRIDTTIPKAWAVSTKVRDRFRREALREDISQHQAWLTSRTPRPSSRASYNGSQGHRSPRVNGTRRLDDGDFDDIDGTTFRGHSPVGREDGSTGQLHLSDDDLRLVNHIIQDSRTSPSKYHHKQMPSNIPSTGLDTRTVNHMTTRHHKSQLLQTYAASPNYLSSAALGRYQGDATNRYITPSSGDLLEKQAHKFTKEKPFMPRTLKTNCTSKLTEFKYYNPPPKKTLAKSSGDATRGGAGMHRSETPMTDSVDLMNETLMSRDIARAAPSGIPPLDISLDADHLLWLKEQSKIAQLRKSHKYMALRPTSSLSHHLLTGKSQKFNTDTKPLPKMRQSLTREDELRYLEFISDVTNDVLDRGIFTNRVLKQVFESHIEKHRGDLKESKMRELLADLWKDLGICPYQDSFDACPVTKRTHIGKDIDSTTAKKQPTSDVVSEASEPVPTPRAAHRQRRSSPTHDHTSPSGSPKMTTLRAAPRHRTRQQTKPPLPGGGSTRGERSVCEDDVSVEEDEEERKAQRDTADMMAAILSNGSNGLLQPTDELSQCDMIDTDEFPVTWVNEQEKEKEAVSSDAVDYEEQTVSHDTVVAKKQPSSPRVSEVEEPVTSSDSHLPNKRDASPEDEMTMNGVQGLGEEDCPHDQLTNSGHLHNDKEEPENADYNNEENTKVDKTNTEKTEKDTPVFNNNENEKDTARSGGYTDDGWESQDDDDDSEEEDTLQRSGNRKKEESPAHSDDDERSLPQATPRQKKPAAAPRSNIKDMPKSLEQTMSSESLDVSDLDEDDVDF